MKITEIEVHEITLEYKDWISYELTHYNGISRRTVYIVHTDTGEIGLGEGKKEPADIIEQYIGSNPFDWLGDETSLPLGTAMYDLMGKMAGIPVLIVGPGWFAKCEMRNAQLLTQAWIRFAKCEMRNARERIRLAAAWRLARFVKI